MIVFEIGNAVGVDAATRGRPCGSSAAAAASIRYLCVCGGSFAALQRRRRLLGRHGAAGEVDLLLGEACRTPTRAGRSSSPGAPWGVWPIQSVMLNVPNSEK